MHIAIAGNIGAGKTTLTTMLAKQYGWKAHFEPVDNNPYLADYYNDMERWAFNLQIYFLNKRFSDIVEIARSSETIIQDRTIFEDARIFAPNLHEMGLMSDRDFDNYTQLFDLMLSLVKLPDLLIYIRCSVPHLIDHIQMRGRDYEQTMRIDYLRGLNKRYEEWIKTYKGHLMIVDGDTTDFAKNPQDFQKITTMIDDRLFGLFPIE
ncbi:MAG: deoxynucleoside kinase [Prevotella sp.]|nr:deoxynucleoside kinase [Prevotella sp.]MDD7273626.1 deoxynucleoside kinase [Prevotellaceae bacterium]MDY3936341.1 deoxynucleoside kinase [Prevotella sp.]MDY4218405.1 deoxynucleoside kinase [Prevotella sp.]